MLARLAVEAWGDLVELSVAADRQVDFLGGYCRGNSLGFSLLPLPLPRAVRVGDVPYAVAE